MFGLLSNEAAMDKPSASFDTPLLAFKSLDLYLFKVTNSE